MCRLVSLSATSTFYSHSPFFLSADLFGSTATTPIHSIRKSDGPTAARQKHFPRHDLMIASIREALAKPRLLDVRDLEFCFEDDSDIDPHVTDEQPAPHWANGARKERGIFWGVGFLRFDQTFGQTGSSYFLFIPNNT